MILCHWHLMLVTEAAMANCITLRHSPGHVECYSLLTTVWRHLLLKQEVQTRREGTWRSKFFDQLFIGLCSSFQWTCLAKAIIWLCHHPLLKNLSEFYYVQLDFHGISISRERDSYFIIIHASSSTLIDGKSHLWWRGSIWQWWQGVKLHKVNPSLVDYEIQHCVVEFDCKFEKYLKYERRWEHLAPYHSWRWLWVSMTVDDCVWWRQLWTVYVNIYDRNITKNVNFSISATSKKSAIMKKQTSEKFQ